MEKFFKNEDLVLAINLMAKNYGKMPTEIMELSIYEFNFNFAVMVIAENKLKKIQDKEKSGDKKTNSLDNLAIDRTVIKIKKTNKDGSKEILTTEEGS